MVFNEPGVHKMAMVSMTCSDEPENESRYGMGSSMLGLTKDPVASRARPCAMSANWEPKAMYARIGNLERIKASAV